MYDDICIRVCIYVYTVYIYMYICIYGIYTVMMNNILYTVYICV